MMKIQAQQQSDQMKLQADQQAAQQAQEIQAQMDQQRMAHEEMMEASRQEHEKVLKQMELEATTERAIKVARISAKSTMDVAHLSTGTTKSDEIEEDFDDYGEQKQTPVDRLAEMQAQTMARIEQLMQHIAKPKMIIKGPDGRPIGVQ